MLKRKLAAAGAVVALALVGLAVPALASDHHGNRHSRHAQDRHDRYNSGSWSVSRDRHNDRHDDSDDDSDYDDDSDSDDSSEDSGTDVVDSDVVVEDGDVAAGGEVLTGSAQTITARLTGYSFQDNSPPGSAIISMPILHKKAGGTGTYADPITTAVPGHAGSTETPKGTRIYVAKLKRYFIVEDSGASAAGQKHFDLWVDGQGFSKSASDKCMNSYTGSAPVILNPAEGLPVTVGPLTGASGCKL